MNDVKEKIILESDNELLSRAFSWAVEKTKQFVMTGKSGIVDIHEARPLGDVEKGETTFIPSYWAGYYNRSAFYARDFAHQSAGAHFVGLDEENFSMFRVFADNATQERQWYTLWAFNFDSSPHTIDYRGDDDFVREVPAQFELVEKAYRQYLWTGDHRYIHSPEMFKFFEKTMTEFIERHDENENGVAEGTGTGGIFSGVSTYNERGGEHPIESGDSVGSQYQATLAYAGILEARGDIDGAAEWTEKAFALKSYFNNDWSVQNKDPNGEYARGIAADGTKYGGFGKENSWFMPMKLITEPGDRNDNYLDFISLNLGDGIGSTPEAPGNIEAYTYIPETYFPYNRTEEAWKWMKYIIGVKDKPHENTIQGTNGDYPEISFTFISHTVEGMMGVSPNAPLKTVSTISRLPSEIGWAALRNVKMGDFIFDLRHDGTARSTLKNNSSQELRWEVQFYGEYGGVAVNEISAPAMQKKLNGLEVSYYYVSVLPGEEVAVVPIP